MMRNSFGGDCVSMSTVCRIDQLFGRFLFPDLASFSRSRRRVSWLMVLPSGTLVVVLGCVGVNRDSSNDDESDPVPEPDSFERRSKKLEFGRWLKLPDWSIIIPWAAMFVVEAVAPVKRP